MAPSLILHVMLGCLLIPIALSQQESNSLQKILSNLQKKTIDGKSFAIIQQRKSGSVSFARNWDEYERGFGDADNFWVGLYTIHLLSMKGVTLGVDMRMGKSEFVQEYPNFKVRDASTNYTMTCGPIDRSRSNNAFDGMSYISGMQFSTIDRKNDKNGNRSCSIYGGGGGWWYKDCSPCYPNNVYGSDNMWTLYSLIGFPLTEIRLMLQI